MRLVVSWLREFVDVKASAEEIAGTLALRGFEVASIEPLDGGDAVIDFEVTANRPDCAERPRPRARGRDRLRPAARAALGRRRRRAVRLATMPVGRLRSDHGHDRGCRAVPAIRRGGRGRADRALPCLDGGAAPGRRRPADQQHRRHHQLREPRDRPADARVRPARASRGRKSACAAPSRARRSRRSTASTGRSIATCWSSPTAIARRRSPA